MKYRVINVSSDNLRTFPHSTVYKFSSYVWLCRSLYHYLWACWWILIRVRVNFCLFPVLQCPISFWILLTLSWWPCFILFWEYRSRQKRPTPLPLPHSSPTSPGENPRPFQPPESPFHWLSFPLLQCHSSSLLDYSQGHGSTL